MIRRPAPSHPPRSRDARSAALPRSRTAALPRPRPVGAAPRMAVALIALGAVAPGRAVGQATLDPTEQRIADWVDGHTDDAVDLLERAVEINSGTLNLEGVRRVGDLFAERLRDLGLDVRWVELPADVARAGHLFAESRPDRPAGATVLLIGHLDTVFEKDDAFQHWTREGDRARGPGVDDMKGGDIVILYALEALRAVGALDDASVIVAFTGDEERPGEPLDVVRRDLVEAGKRADIALGFEAAVRIDGQEYATIARRSSSDWTLEVSGKQAHSSGIFQEEYGAGAIFEAARILNGFYDEVRGEEYLTFNAGVILGGTTVGYDPATAAGTAFGKTNVIPNRVVVHGGLRTISPEQTERAREKMRAVVARHLPVTEASITFQEGYPPMPPTEANRRLVRRYDEVTRALGAGALELLDPAERGAADISFVAPHVHAALAGLGSYGGGGHTPDEWIDLAALPLAIKRAAILIYRLTHTPPE